MVFDYWFATAILFHGLIRGLFDASIIRNICFHFQSHPSDTDVDREVLQQRGIVKRLVRHPHVPPGGRCVDSRFADFHLQIMGYLVENSILDKR